MDTAFGDLGQQQLAEGVRVAAAHAEHLGDGGAGDIGIEDAYLVARAHELRCDAAADERLAHASLAGQNGDDVLDLGEGVLLKLLRCGFPAGFVSVFATHARMLLSLCISAFGRTRRVRFNKLHCTHPFEGRAAVVSTAFVRS